MKRLALLPFILTWVGSAACSRGRPATDSISIAVPYEVSSLDPHAKNTLSDFAIVSQFYEPLVTTDARMQLHPCLARLWENPDPSTWVFHLQEGARFHDGRPLSARDVVFSIRRLLETPGLQMTGYVVHVEEAVALDPLTVRIRTTSPVSVLLNKLRFVLIVPEGATTESLKARPNGTGPYRLVDWNHSDRLSLVRNDGYWARPPEMRRVEFLLGRSPDQAVKDLLAGRSQLIQFNSKRLEPLVQPPEKFQLLRHPSIFLKYIGFNLVRSAAPATPSQRNPFESHPVREAVNLAIDRRLLVQSLSTDAIPAREPVPPAIFGFNPRIHDPRFDPARARELLAKAGYPTGLASTLHVRKIFAEAAHLVRDQMRNAGFELQVSELADAEFFELAQRHEMSLFFSRFGCPTGDASDVLDNAFHSTDAARRVGLQNYAGYASPEVDRAIEESAGIESIFERRAALETIMEMLMEELVWVPLYADQDVYGISRDFSWQPRSDSFVLAAEIAPRKK